ncbi:hypothetical protein ACQY0O_000103 [Thecaphora frezii]
MSPPSSLPDAGKLAEARYPQGMNQPQQSQLEVEETLPPHRTGSTLDAEVVGRGQSSGDGEGVQVIVDEKGAGSDLLDSPPSSSSSSTEFVKADEARRSSQPGSEMADVTAPPDSRAATDDDDDEAVQRPSLSDASDRAEGYDPYATPTGRAEADEGDDSSQRAICRICLEGPGDTSDDGESLGRLLSPCRCKGTMKYVHATCLDRWRALSARTSSGVACDQCGAPYRFRQSRFVGLATSPSLLFGLSVFLFLALIWTTGLVASLVLQRYDNSLVPDTSSAPTSKAEANTAAPAGQGTSRGWHGWMTGDDQEAQTAWEVQDGYSYWGYTGFYYEPWAYAKLVREAVRQFTSGEATEAVKGLVGLDAEVDDEREEAPGPQADADADEPAEQEQSFWSALKWEWKYGEGGIWQGQQPVEQQAAEAAAAAGSAVQGPGDKAPTADEAQKGQGDEAPRPPRERYDARNARPYDTQKSRKARASRQSRSRSRSRKAAASTAQPGWLDKLLLQCMSHPRPPSPNPLSTAHFPVSPLFLSTLAQSRSASPSSASYPSSTSSSVFRFSAARSTSTSG